jgi:2-alkenal reductase
MTDRSIRAAVFGVLVLLAGVLSQIQLNRAYSDKEPKSLDPLSGLLDAEQMIAQLFERTAVSVVQISTISGGGEPSNSKIQVGSGFVWDSAGNIVTNEHVVNSATIIWIWFASGETVEGEVIATAPDYDLAVIHPKQSHVMPPPMPIGSSSGLKVGQFAFAIGSPFGLDQSLTVGVISALNRRLPTSQGHQISNMIQTDAATYPGNSGGPLLNSAGRLIGVNTISYSIPGSQVALGFAIPADLVTRVIPELIAGARTPGAGIGKVPADGEASVDPLIHGVVPACLKSGSSAVGR